MGFLLGKDWSDAVYSTEEQWFAARETSMKKLGHFIGCYQDGMSSEAYNTNFKDKYGNTVGRVRVESAEESADVAKKKQNALFRN